MKRRAGSVLQRVHRHLTTAEIEALRDQLAALVPEERADIARLVKTMRLATRRSQSEYARLCGVAPRVLAQIEAGRRNVQVETLEKLLRPFGCRIGVVGMLYNAA
jgi:DNA-binding XRE family transcriptional regulator